MQFLALASDYDGTLAHDGHVEAEVVAALRRLQGTGRKLVLVTGREVAELKAVFADVRVFDLVVAENGALLYWPSDEHERLLAEPPSDQFVMEARRRGVAPFSLGKSIFATWRPHEVTLLKVIQTLGLDYQIIFNKDSVMVLPGGVNKASGLAAASEELGIPTSQMAGIGDAENDTAFLKTCGFSAAVANALPSVKQSCHWVSAGDHGRGAVELIEHILADDLASLLEESKRVVSTAGTNVENQHSPDGAAVEKLDAGQLKQGKSVSATTPGKILVLDIGGTSIKVLASGQTEPRKIESGPQMTPAPMVEAVKRLAEGWEYEAVSIGYPGQVGDHGPRSEPGNLGSGWVGFDFAAAFGMPVRIINDAAMQALGSYDGGRMLFLGLGTGLGSALISENVIVTLELGELPGDVGQSLGEILGRKGLDRLGKKVWRDAVERAVQMLTRAFLVDYIVLGGGNSKELKVVPHGARLGHNLTAFRGGFRLWHLEDVQTLSPDGPHHSPPLPAATEWRVL